MSTCSLIYTSVSFFVIITFIHFISYKMYMFYLKIIFVYFFNACMFLVWNIFYLHNSKKISSLFSLKGVAETSGWGEFDLPFLSMPCLIVAKNIEEELPSHFTVPISHPLWHAENTVTVLFLPGCWYATRPGFPTTGVKKLQIWKLEMQAK